MKLTRRGFCAGSSAGVALLLAPSGAHAAAMREPTRHAGVGEVWGLAFWSHDLAAETGRPPRRAAAPGARPADAFAYCF